MFVNFGIVTGIHFAIGANGGAFILLPDFQIIQSNSVAFFLFEPIDLGLLIVTLWRQFVNKREACPFGNSGAVCKNPKTGAF